MSLLLLSPVDGPLNSCLLGRTQRGPVISEPVVAYITCDRTTENQRIFNSIRYLTIKYSVDRFTSQTLMQREILYFQCDNIFATNPPILIRSVSLASTRIRPWHISHLEQRWAMPNLEPQYLGADHLPCQILE